MAAPAPDDERGGGGGGGGAGGWVEGAGDGGFGADGFELSVLPESDPGGEGAAVGGFDGVARAVVRGAAALRAASARLRAARLAASSRAC
jgi:hypothetical protein